MVLFVCFGFHYFLWREHGSSIILAPSSLIPSPAKCRLIKKDYKVQKVYERLTHLFSASIRLATFSSIC